MTRRHRHRPWRLADLRERRTGDRALRIGVRIDKPLADLPLE